MLNLLGQTSEVRSRSWDFNVRSSESNMEFRSPTSPGQPPTVLSKFVFRFLSFFCFFFHAKLRSQTSKFQLRISKFELRTQTSMFNVPPPPRQPPTVFSMFFLVFFFFFHAKLRSQTSKFQVRTFEVGILKSGFKVQTSNFEVGTLMSGFKVQTSNFEVVTLKSGFKVQTWNLEHLWELHGRDHPPLV